jgi:large subunit ribosomal protein L30
MTKKTKAEKVSYLRVTQKRSTIGVKPQHKDSIRSLGLRRINHTVEVVDTPCIRGVINSVGYLIKVEEV